MEFKIPANASVRLLGQIIEKMDLTKRYQSYSRHGGNQARPRSLLAILVFLKSFWLSGLKHGSRCSKKHNLAH
jgi:hypothetical protein